VLMARCYNRVQLWCVRIGQSFSVLVTASYDATTRRYRLPRCVFSSGECKGVPCRCVLNHSDPLRCSICPSCLSCYGRLGPHGQVWPASNRDALVQ